MSEYRQTFVQSTRTDTSTGAVTAELTCGHSLQLDKMVKPGDELHCRQCNGGASGPDEVYKTLVNRQLVGWVAASLAVLASRPEVSGPQVLNYSLHLLEELQNRGCDGFEEELADIRSFLKEKGHV